MSGSRQHIVDRVASRPSLDTECRRADWILPKRLRLGLREALDAGGGRLRMDPQELANLVGAAIDREVERLERIRERREHKRRLAAAFREAESYIAPDGRRPPAGQSWAPAEEWTAQTGER